MAEGAREVWVRIDEERFLVKVEDLHQRPIVATVEGRRFEIEVSEGLESSKEVDLQVQKKSTKHSIPAGTCCQITAPMPGDITHIDVLPGQAVKAGDPLCVLDAMKMKNTIHAPQDGVISEIRIREGQSVEHGVPLFTLE